MKRTYLVLAFLLSAVFCQGQEKGFFENPVIRGDMADPSIIRIGDDYYATGTSSEWAPYYPLYKSRDMVNWKQVGHVFDTKPEWTSNSFWAPELFCHDGKVYCYYTARQKSTGISYIGVAVADSPEEGFTDCGPVVTFGNEAIDAFVFEDKGELYISWKAYGLDKRPIELLCSRLSDDGLRMEGEIFSLLKDDQRIGMEGQCIFRHGEYYYLIYSAHSCCGRASDYDVYVARSTDFKGPYEKFGGNPILHGGIGDFQSCGHGTVVTAPDGRMFYLCHAYLAGDGFCTGRQPVMHELEITGDGWPRFKTGSVAMKIQPAPFKGTVQKVEDEFHDSFNGKELKKEWSWNYTYADISAALEGGSLILSGTPLAGNMYGTALCVRAQEPDFVFEAGIGQTDRELKGLTLYGDSGNMAVWGYRDGKLVMDVIMDGKETVLFSTPWEGPAHLRMAVDAGTVTGIWWSQDGKEWRSPENLSLDVTGLERWDRVQRPGLIYCGGPDGNAEFSYFTISYR